VLIILTNVGDFQQTPTFKYLGAVFVYKEALRE
jgi:hypothetical protein